MDMRALTQHARSDCVHDVQQAIREKTYLRKIQGHLRNATENRIDRSFASFSGHSEENRLRSARLKCSQSIAIIFMHVSYSTQDFLLISLAPLVTTRILFCRLTSHTQ